jgi:hypothetical protein|tara:strand:+ start:3200 stop:3619 length:420 start_codon:yes stop_codon:yes gene_type:complete
MEYKVIMDRAEKDRLDSMWYRSSDHDPIKVVKYKDRIFRLEAFGEVDVAYKGERFYCASEISELKTDQDLHLAIQNGELELSYNNWFEVRPDAKYNDYVYAGVYDDVYYDANDLDLELCKDLIYLEKTYDQDFGDICLK